MEMTKSRKGQIFSQMSALGIGIAALALTLIITFLIISTGRDNISSMGNACADPRYAINTSPSGDVCCNTSNIICTTENNPENYTFGFSYAYNATHDLGSAVETIPGWVPLVVIAVIGSILLSLVAMFRNR